MAKKFEINLTPQNEEWIKLIPNAVQNNDIIFNKLIEAAISEGLLLEVISQSLTVGDLAKFKNGYAKMQTKRAEYMSELDVTPIQIERKRATPQVPQVPQTPLQTVQPTETEQEEINQEKVREISTLKPNKRKMSHGFDEDTF